MKQILIILSIVLFVKAEAQQLSLQEAINISLKNNYNIRIAKNVVAINKINNNIGMAGGLPSVNATASDQESVVGINQKLNTGTSISRSGVSSNALNANVTGSVLLYNGYKVVATKSRLEELQKQSEQLFNAQLQNTIASVMLTYYNVVRQQNYMKTLQQSIDLSKKQLELIQTKKEVGLANNADLFQSQIDLNTRLQDMQSQELVVAQTKSDLLNLLNIRPDSSITISDTIQVDKNILLADVLNGLNKNPQILSLSNQVKINELIEKETAALRKPSLRANAGVNFGRTQSAAGQLLLNQSYGPFVGIGVSIPIYNGGVLKRQQQTAGINTQNAKLQKEGGMLEYQTGAVKVFQSYTNSLEQLNTQLNTFQLSQQLVDLSLQRFRLASATIIEVREAQKSFEEAGFRLVNLLYTAKIAEIELKRLSNQLSF